MFFLWQDVGVLTLLIRRWQVPDTRPTIQTTWTVNIGPLSHQAWRPESISSHLTWRVIYLAGKNEIIYVKVNIDYHCLTGENRFRLFSRGESNVHIFWSTQVWLVEDQQRAKRDFWFFLWIQKWPECHSNWTVCCFNFPFRWHCKWQWLQAVFLLCFTR